jgi:hypothetical protein
LQGEREVGRVVVGKAVLLCEGRQFEDFAWNLLGCVYRKCFEPRQKTIDLVESNRFRRWAMSKPFPTS